MTLSNKTLNNCKVCDLLRIYLPAKVEIEVKYNNNSSDKVHPNCGVDPGSDKEDAASSDSFHKD